MVKFINKRKNIMNNFKNLTLAIVASLGMASAVNASEVSSNVSWSNAAVGVSHINTGNTDGAFVRGSTLASDNVFIFGDVGYDHNDNVDVGLLQARVGAGLRVTVASDMDLYGALYGSYGSVLYDFDTRIDDDWGYGVEGGVRTLAGGLEFKFGAGYERFNTWGNDSYVVVGAAYNVTDAVVVVVDVKHNLDSAYQATAGVRFGF